jgi:hypothetical protein
LTLVESGTYTHSMVNRRAAFAVLAALLSTTLLYAQAQQRVVYVSALDKTGAPVAALAPTDVIVREDNVAREVLRVAPADEPMQIALLIDNSQAAEPFIRDYREGLGAFVTAVTAGTESGMRNEVAVITVGERPTIAQDFSFDRTRLLAATGRIFSTMGSASYLLDGIIEVSQGLSKRGAMRPVIVAITTEGPELSDRDYRQVLDPLRVSGAALHVLVIGRPINNEHDRGVVLTEGPRNSGGQYDNLLAPTALTSRLKQLANELTHQFRVTYARPQRLIPPERVTVSSAKPDLIIRGTPAVEPPMEKK